MLRVAARIRHELGEGTLDPVVTAYEVIFRQAEGDQACEIDFRPLITLSRCSPRLASTSTSQAQLMKPRGTMIDAEADRPVSRRPRRWYANHFVWRGRSFILRAGDLEFHGAQMR